MYEPESFSERTHLICSEIAAYDHDSVTSMDNDNELPPLKDVLQEARPRRNSEGPQQYIDDLSPSTDGNCPAQRLESSASSSQGTRGMLHSHLSI
jgi:hypothetical protein